MNELDSDIPRKVPRNFNSVKFIPNFLTLFALCVGLTALRFGIAGKWSEAAIFIMIAAILDGLDGYVARALDASSIFGAQLDSFTDFISFGVAPALIIYLWGLENGGPFGWFATLIFCVAVALRLARFNTKDLQRSKDLTTAFFEGVPAPAGAILAMIPIFLSNQFMQGRSNDIPTIYIEIWMFFIAGLMVSKLPTYSLKNINLNMGLKQRLTLGASSIVFCIALAFAPWTTIIISSFLYLIALVHCSRNFKKRTS